MAACETWRTICDCPRIFCYANCLLHLFVTFLIWICLQLLVCV